MISLYSLHSLQNAFISIILIFPNKMYTIVLLYIEYYLSGWNEIGGQLNDESEKVFLKRKEYVWS